MEKNPVDLRRWQELFSALEELGRPEGTWGLRVLEEAEKEGDQAFLSHKEAGELLRALSEALEALSAEEAWGGGEPPRGCGFSAPRGGLGRVREGSPTRTGQPGGHHGKGVSGL